MKKTRIALIALFLCLPLTLGVLTVALPERDFSDQENRTLATFPALSWRMLTDNAYQQEISDAMNDQFPLREQMVCAATVLRKCLGARDCNGVYFGSEHFYLQKITDDDLNAERYAKNLRYLSRLAATAPALRVMLVPDAGNTFPELLPAGARMYDADAMLRTARESLTVPVLDPRKALCTVGHAAYYKTDHHWTSRGAYAAMGLLSDGLVPYEQAGFSAVTDDFYGTLYSKALDPAAEPDTIECKNDPGLTVTFDGAPGVLYDRTALSRKDQYQVFFGGNHGLVTITGGCKNGRTMLVIKDSFANCAAPILAEQYETVLLVDPRYYAGSTRALLAQYAVTDTLLLMELSSFANATELSRILL